MTTINQSGFTLRKSKGFTIIELLLFLGISVVLFAALMVGVNTNMTQQRYRNDVVNLSSYLKEQYSEVINTRNDQDGTSGCLNSTITTTSPTARGTSTCVILGRAIQILASGNSIKSSGIMGTDDPEQASSVSNNDIDSLIAYQPKLSDFETTEANMDWQTVLRSPDGRVSTASILILRSPASGLIKIFTSEGSLPSDNDLTTMINSTNTGALELCVDGFSGSLPKQAVVINPGISGLNGISIKEFGVAC